MSARSVAGVVIAAHEAQPRKVTQSPFGKDDQMGMLNILTPEMREEVLDTADPRVTFDLAVEYFMGMPAYLGADDPPYQICLTHSPLSAGGGEDAEFGGGVAGYSGDMISMYTHTGTHIDTLNHFGYGEEVWNGYRATKHVGDRHWNVSGPEKIPPIVTRGVLLDFAKSLGMDALPDSYGIGPEDIQKTLQSQGTEIKPGDVVFFRTGRMGYWPDVEKFTPGYRFPGINLDGAKALAHAGAVMVGTDCMSPEQAPSVVDDHPAPVHSYLLSECGVLIAENLWLEGLAKEGVYEFAFVAAPIKFRGATGAPMRPVAFPLK
jgi:kynurenine formamidase